MYITKREFSCPVYRKLGHILAITLLLTHFGPVVNESEWEWMAATINCIMILQVIWKLDCWIYYFHGWSTLDATDCNLFRFLQLASHFLQHRRTIFLGHHLLNGSKTNSSRPNVIKSSRFTTLLIMGVRENSVQGHTSLKIVQKTY